MKYKQTISIAVNTHRQDILDFLEKMISINSYSYNKTGIDKVGRLVQDYMPSCFRCEVDHQSDNGDNYIYRHNPNDREVLLLAGHIDTLCPENPKFNRLYDNGDTLIGPGVNDMKGGDTVLIWALKILDEIGVLKNYPISCIFNGDEEIGSPISYPLFQSMKNEAKMAMIFECSSPEGSVVTTRKGCYRKKMNITGIPNHFGNLKEKKVSAVEELAHRIIQLEGYNCSDGEIAANAGKIWGGLARNAVAEKAGMDFDVRFWDMTIRDKFIEEFENSLKKPYVEGCKIELKDLPQRPAMTPSPISMELFDLIVDTGKKLEQKIVEEKRGGFSDANWLTDVGIPTIDGLGPLGDKDFTTEEYIIKESLFERIELVSNLIIRIFEKWF